MTSARFFMLSTRAVHFAVHRWSLGCDDVLLHTREVDNAGDGPLLLVTLRGGVALLHPVGEVARDAPDDDVGDLRVVARNSF
jgi:hypothetical protein